MSNGYTYDKSTKDKTFWYTEDGGTYYFNNKGEQWFVSDDLAHQWKVYEDGSAYDW